MQIKIECSGSTSFCEICGVEFSRSRDKKEKHHGFCKMSFEGLGYIEVCLDCDKLRQEHEVDFFQIIDILIELKEHQKKLQEQRDDGLRKA